MDPIVQHYSELASEHKILSKTEWRILDALQDQGPIRTDRLRSTLRLEGKTNTAPFHRALTNLERLGIITGRGDPKPEKHMHANIWRLWKSSTPRSKTSLNYKDALAELVRRAVDVAVLAAEREIKRWFGWNGEVSAAKESLVANGKFIRAGEFLIASRIVEA